LPEGVPSRKGLQSWPGGHRKKGDLSFEKEGGSFYKEENLYHVEEGSISKRVLTFQRLGWVVFSSPLVKRRRR